MIRRRFLALALAAGLAFASVRADAAAEQTAGERVAERCAPAMLKLDVVIEMNFELPGRPSMAREMKTEMDGAVVDPSGLVLVGLPTHLFRALESQMPGLKITFSPKQIRVTLAGEWAEHDAIIVVRDATLGLAFVQILGLDGKTLPSLDLGVEGTIDPSADLYGVSRAARGYDHAAQVFRTHVTGAIEQPRKARTLSGQFSEHGLPVFDGEGKPVGLYTVEIGAEGLTGLQSGNFSEGMLGILLPLDLARASLASAKKRVPEAMEKAKTAAADKPVGDDAKKPPAPADGAPPAPAPDPTPAPTPTPGAPKDPNAPR